MNKLLIAFLLWFALGNPLFAASTGDEIEHLLSFVAESGCIFERNGTRYDSVEARVHIQRKYDHIKDRVNSTEDFIRYAASKSSMSGKKYQATCDGQTISSEEWLTKELKRYRQPAS
jgi:hypothetical protein